MDYFANFIELERLRQDHHITLNLQTALSSTGALVIAPFVLMPFVENAFKHVSQRIDQPNWINVDLSLCQHELRLNIANSIASTPDQPGEAGSLDDRLSGGLGLKNARRRLDLLYPEQYDLEIRPDGHEFRVSLRLALREQRAPQPMLS